jgi:hypothetical protein
MNIAARQMDEVELGLNREHAEERGQALEVTNGGRTFENRPGQPVVGMRC